MFCDAPSFNMQKHKWDLTATHRGQVGWTTFYDASFIHFISWCSWTQHTFIVQKSAVWTFKVVFSFGLYRFGMTWEWVIDRICLSNYYFKYSCLSLKLDTWQLRVWNRLPSEVPSCKNQLLGLKLFTTVDHLSLLWHKMHSMTASLK